MISQHVDVILDAVARGMMTEINRIDAKLKCLEGDIFPFSERAMNTLDEINQFAIAFTEMQPGFFENKSSYGLRPNPLVKGSLVSWALPDAEGTDE